MPLNLFGDLPIVIDETKTNAIDNDVSVIDTIEKMKQLVYHCHTKPTIQRAVYDATRYLGDNASDKDIISAVYYWIKSRVKYVEDDYILQQALGITFPDNDKELLISPDALLLMPKSMGDCDDFSVLISTMLYALGFKVWFVTIAADETMPEKFSHVYTKAYMQHDMRDIYLDASHGHYPGWEHKQAYRKAEWEI